MVTTRSQEKRINETPKSSASQNGFTVSVTTPALSDHSPRFFTPATSKPARITSDGAILGKLERNGNEAGRETSTPLAPQDDDQHPATGTRDQQKSGSFAGVHLPSKASSARAEKIPPVAGIETRSDISAELPQRPKAPELYFTPMTTSKRKRFDSQGSDDSISEPETLLRQRRPDQPSRGAIVEVAEAEDDVDDNDDDDTPEVLSSKTAAQQALSTPLPASRNATKKRKKTNSSASARVAALTTLSAESTPTQVVSAQKDLDRVSARSGAGPPPTQSEERPIAPPSTELLTTTASKQGALVTAANSTSPSHTGSDALLKTRSSTVPGEMWPVVSEVIDPVSSGTEGADVPTDKRQSIQDVNGDGESSAKAAVKPDDMHIPSDTATGSTQLEDISPELEVPKDVVKPTTQAKEPSKSVVAAGRHPTSSRRPTDSSTMARARAKAQLSRPFRPTKPQVTSLQEYRGTLLNRHPRTTNRGPRRARFVDV